jgi:hypothetical protein
MKEIGALNITPLWTTGRYGRGCAPGYPTLGFKTKPSEAEWVKAVAEAKFLYTTGITLICENGGKYAFPKHAAASASSSSSVAAAPPEQLYGFDTDDVVVKPLPAGRTTGPVTHVMYIDGEEPDDAGLVFIALAYKNVTQAYGETYHVYHGRVSAGVIASLLDASKRGGVSTLVTASLCAYRAANRCMRVHPDVVELFVDETGKTMHPDSGHDDGIEAVSFSSSSPSSSSSSSSSGGGGGGGGGV